MNKQVNCKRAGAYAAALVCGMAAAGAAAHAAAPSGADREGLRSALADYAPAPASELARSITRDAVDAREMTAHLTASYLAARSDFLMAEVTPRPATPVVSDKGSARNNRGTANAGALGWLRDGLIKLAALLRFRPAQ